MSSIYDVSQKKQMLQKIKRIRDFDVVASFTGETSSGRIYYADILAQWLKCQKLDYSRDNVAPIAFYIFDNIRTILKDKTYHSTDILQSLSNCCWGLLHYLRTFQSKHLSTSLLMESAQQLLCYIKEFHLPRDQLILIQPLLIWTLSVESPSDIFALFSDNDYYNISSCICCFLKSKLSHQKDTIEFLLKYSLRILQNSTVIHNHYSYFSIIESCLLQLQKNENPNAVNLILETFSVTACYTDDRGTNTSSICIKIQELCITIVPRLVEQVKTLASCPWYSRQRYIYTNILIDNYGIDCDPVTFFSNSIKCLGYNRLDHTVIRTIKRFVSKYLTDATFKPFLEEYFYSVSVKPTLTRILADYIGPMLLSKPECFPEDLDSYINELSTKVTGLSLVLVLFLFQDKMEQTLKLRIINSVSGIGDSEGQSLIMKIICRENLAMEQYKHHFEHILSMNCPTVRQHAICSLKVIIQQAKHDKSDLGVLITLFEQFIRIDSPYHQCMLSLNFFCFLLQKHKFSAHDEAISKLSTRFQELIDQHDDMDIVNLVKECLTYCTLNAEANSERANENGNIFGSGETITNFLNAASAVDYISSFSEHKIGSLISLLTQELSYDIDRNQLCVTAKASLLLVRKLLGMISEDATGYSAPSFEESYLIVARAFHDDEDQTRTATKLIWASISDLLKLNDKIFQLMIRFSMDLYISDQPDFGITDIIDKTGETCIECIFR